MNFTSKSAVVVLVAALLALGLATSPARAAVPLSSEPLILTPEALAAQDFDIADLDGDGFLDIAVGCYNAPNVVYLNRFGDFSSYDRWESTESDYTMSLSLADISGSAMPELFAGNSIGQCNRLYLNSAHGLSEAAGWSSADARWTNVTIPFDFDGDGFTDIFCGGTAENVIYRNEGGSLNPEPFWVAPRRDETRAAAIADINGDGTFYLAVGNIGLNRVYRITAGLPEDEPVWTSPDWQPTYSLDFGDYDADGDLDLLVGNLDAKDQVFAKTGVLASDISASDGDFGEAAVWTSSDAGPTRSIKWCDFGEDGYPDVAVATFRSQANAVYSNVNGVIETAPSWLSEDEGDTTSMLCGDLDGNGSDDMIVANQGSYVVAYLSLLHSAPFVVGTTPEDGDTNVSRIAQISVLLHDYDEDINVETAELLVNGDSASFSVTTSSEGSTIQYAPSDGYPPSSQVQVVVRAADLESNQMPEYEFSFTTAQNTAPTLKNGGVDPSSGDDQGMFIYSVDYADVDYDPPARAVTVVLAEDETKVAELAMERTLAYSYNSTYRAMTSLEQGYYYYYFEFVDTFGASSRLPTTGYYSGPEVSRHNMAPMLASPMLTPPTGDTDTTFWFSVYYWDVDKDAASTANVVVKTSTKEYSWDMVLQDGSADDGTFSYCGVLPAGTYSYYFLFADERGAAVRMPSTGYYIGPVVTGESSPSILSYGGVSPSLGSTSTSFEFRVHFFDADGNEPSASTLYYRTDMAHTVGMTLGNGMLYDGDYTYKTKLTAQMQWYYFHFVTKAGGVLRLPEQGYLYGPNLAGFENKSLLDSGGVDPVTGGAGGEYSFSVHYYDVAGRAPSSAEVHVEASGWSGAETMKLVTGQSPSNGEYKLGVALGANAYVYYFVFLDGRGSQVRLPETGSFKGPFVDVSNRTPSLTDGGSWPQCGTTSEMFTFSVHYFDEDGNEPGIARVILHAGGDIVPADLTLESGTAANGTYSVETAAAPGNVQYRFRFVDTRGGPAVYPQTGLSDGPTVGDFALSLAVDADVVSSPDVLKLTLNLANDASIGFTATLGAAIQFPTGELMFFPDWGFSLTGLEVDFPAGFEVADYPLLTTQVPDSAPIGPYMAYAAIFGPGDFDCVLSDMAQVAWRIEARK